jgi:hypothetical protein
MPPMNLDPHKPDPPKKPVTKNWVPQAKRTADSVKKLKKGVDQLKPWATVPGQKEPYRTEIPARILPILCGLKRRPVPHDAIIHALTATLFEHCFKLAPGCKIELEVAWQKVISRLQQLRPDVVQWLNSEVHRSAFFWQIAGHVDSYFDPLKAATTQVLIVQAKRGLRKGELVQVLELHNGSMWELSADWYPDWPTFLFVGDYWGQEPAYHRMVVNMSFSWPCPAVEQILKIILWEPPLRVFKERKSKK